MAHPPWTFITMKRLIVLAFVLLPVVSEPIFFKDCAGNSCLRMAVRGTGSSEPGIYHFYTAFSVCRNVGKAQTISVDISPCPAQPCVFTEGDTATVKVTFRSPNESSTLKGQIFGFIAGVKVKWPMPDPDGCHASNITCPVSGGKVYTYVSTLGVPKGAPKIRLVVEWSLIGDKGEKQFCFDFPVEIA